MKKKINIKTTALILSVLLTVCLVICTVMPAVAKESKISSDPAYASVSETSIESEETGNVTYAVDVSAEMCQASYWKNKAIGGADTLLMTSDEITALNRKALATSAANMYDLENMTPSYNANSLKNSLKNGSVPDDDVYVNGVLLSDKDSYYQDIFDAIDATGYTATTATIKYALGTTRTDMKNIPTLDYIGYSSNDTDDEAVISSVCVNEPLILKQTCQVNGHTFYWGYTNCCCGWVDGDDIAICSNRNEWLDSWKVTQTGKDFVVVTQDKIVLEASVYAAYSSEVKLTLGTVLKLVPQKELPTSVAERYSYNNYVVYLPVRNSDGSYKKEMALISQHYSLSTGFLPMTQSNILDVAFSCLGNRYGWGGMLDAMDCSAYTRTIYECFGLELPRNTTEQRTIDGTLIDISSMTETEKEKLLETLPAGTLMYFTGHTMVYIGSENGKNYEISATGVFYENLTDVKNTNTIVITPMTVTRKNQKTWLNQLSTLVLPWGLGDVADCTISISKNETSGELEVVVKDIDVTLVENVNYTKQLTTDPATGIVTCDITGINNYSGTAQDTYDPKNPCKEHTPVTDPAVPATCTSTGLTEGSHCSVCGKVITAQQTVPALEHSWESKYTVDKQATAATTGLMSIHCKNCTATKNATVIPATGTKGSDTKDNTTSNKTTTDKTTSDKTTKDSSTKDSTDKTEDASDKTDKTSDTSKLTPTEKKSANEASKDSSKTDSSTDSKDKSSSSDKDDKSAASSSKDSNNKSSGNGSTNLYLWVALTASVILNLILGILLIREKIRNKRKNVYRPNDYR